MKLCSKEALVLGGIYAVWDIPFSILGFEILSDTVFWLFVVCAFLLCLNRTPKFLRNLISEYSKTSYYLAAVGWIPYVAIIIVFPVLGGSCFFTYPETFMSSFLRGLTYVGSALFLFSLAVAYAKMRKNKESSQK